MDSGGGWRNLAEFLTTKHTKDAKKKNISPDLSADTQILLIRDGGFGLTRSRGDAKKGGGGR